MNANDITDNINNIYTINYSDNIHQVEKKVRIASV